VWQYFDSAFVISVCTLLVAISYRFGVFCNVGNSIPYYITSSVDLSIDVSCLSLELKVAFGRIYGCITGFMFMIYFCFSSKPSFNYSSSG